MAQDKWLFTLSQVRLGQAVPEKLHEVVTTVDAASDGLQMLITMAGWDKGGCYILAFPLSDPEHHIFCRLQCGVWAQFVPSDDHWLLKEVVGNTPNVQAAFRFARLTFQVNDFWHGLSQGGARGHR